MQRPVSFLVSIAFVLAACAPSVAPQSPPSLATPTSAIAPLTAPTPTTMAPIMTKPFDPVAVGLTVDGVRAICDDHLALAKTILDEIRGKAGASADQLTYANTIGRFDDAVAEIDNASQFPYLMGVAHPDKAVRDAAKECEPKVEQVNTGLYLDAKLASVLKAYAAKGEKLEGERARLLSDTIRDFRRNGLELSADDQTKLRALNKEITDLGQQVNTNIASSTGHVALDPKQLEGLSPEYIAKHPAKDGKVSISTDYPDYFPFVTYAKDRKAALQLEVLFENRGGDENVKLLERLFSLRNDKAKLLGYATWADYQTEPRMAKSAATVATFLAHVRDAVREPAKREFAEMVQEHVALGGKATDAIPLSDRYYLEDKLRNKKYKFDSKELSAYFEVGSVTRGLLDVTAQMYGLEYKEVPAEAWHADVKAYEVHSDGKLIGKFYLDLYPRDGKYKHAAMFPIRPAKFGRRHVPDAGSRARVQLPAPRGARRSPRAHGAHGRRDVLPRVRPRAAPHPHALRAGDLLRHEHRAGLHRSAFADVRRVGVEQGRPRPLRQALRDRREDPRRALRLDDEIARLRPRALHAAAAVPRLARPRVPHARAGLRFDQDGRRGDEAEQPVLVRARHALPGLVRAPRRRLRRGLLRLPVVAVALARRAHALQERGDAQPDDGARLA